MRVPVDPDAAPLSVEFNRKSRRDDAAAPR